MPWTVNQLWRHPIKGIGAEPLETMDLFVDLPVPLDRAWALLEEGGEAGDGWRSCRNFIRGAKGPSLMAITARTEGETLHLRHPDRPDIALTLGAPETEAALIDWITPIYPDTRRPPVALIKSPKIGMADAPFASVSILNCASLRALGQKLGQTLDPRRFRGNIWLDGMAPWEEFDLVGKTLAIDDVRLEVMEITGRCRATEANPDTGRRDAATLQALEDGWGHTQFGVYAMVRHAGSIAKGATAALV